MVSYGETSLKNAVSKALLGVSTAAATSAVMPSNVSPVQMASLSEASTTINVEYDTNGSQIAGMVPERMSEQVSERELNGSRTGYKRFPNGYQTVTEWFPNGRPILATVPEQASERVSNGSRTGYKILNFLSLPPRQRGLLKTLYLNAKINGNRATQRLSLSGISDLAGIGSASVKTGIHRLKTKGFLATKESKGGCGGWVSYEIPESVYFEMLNLENSLANGSSMGTERVSEQVSEREPAATYSSSNYINKRTTTIAGNVGGPGAADTATASDADRMQRSTLPEAWRNIDIEPLSQIGFSLQHLRTIHASGLANPQMVQESINHYAWGLANNADAYKEYKNSLRPFIGVLKKGGAWIESGYESPKKAGLKKLIELKQIQRRQQNKQIDELLEIEFPMWKDFVGPEKLNEIAPSKSVGGFSARQTLWKEYFRKHVLVPRLKAEGAIESYDSEIKQLSEALASESKVAQ